MSTPQLIAFGVQLAVIGAYVWVTRRISRVLVSRCGFGEAMASSIVAVAAFMLASVVWVYFDLWSVLESYGIPVKR